MMSDSSANDLRAFEARLSEEEPRAEDWRSQYSRDRARIIHGAAFRRLQGKTQVMGAGEGDFHRTRLTHSLEVAQICLGLFEGLEKRSLIPDPLKPYAKNCRPILSAASYAHDLGHPPFGHGGERALHEKMKEFGGFEGNAQTVRLLVKLEKYKPGLGINPTRRVLLSILKYPANFKDYPKAAQLCTHPPKCYYNEESRAIEWALIPFSEEDRIEFTRIGGTDEKRKTIYKTFDASMMECADDIAYCAHDLEDIVARKLVEKDAMLDKARDFFKNNQINLGNNKEFSFHDFESLFKDSYTRKETIGKLINLLMVSTYIVEIKRLHHPLLRYNIGIDQRLHNFVSFLKKDLTYKMVVSRPEVQMLEIKGQMIIGKLFEQFIKLPDMLITGWNDVESSDTTERRVCDYIAGMTDAYAAKIYNRMFTPGFGNSRDEL